MNRANTVRNAIFDPTGTYRYSLSRQWDQDLPIVGFVMLNPSRADAAVDDPTIRRCMDFAHRWQFGGLEVVNLFAYRTTQPTDLRQVCEPIGIDNDRYLQSLPQRVTQIILAWGNWGSLQARDRAVLALLTHQPLYCLGRTKVGQPRHPLYLAQQTQPITFTALKDLRKNNIPPISLSPHPQIT